VYLPLGNDGFSRKRIHLVLLHFSELLVNPFVVSTRIEFQLAQLGQHGWLVVFVDDHGDP
jgi:hypothetical protein